MSEILNVRGHRFFNTLRPESLVVDIGAHKGSFSKKILERFDCEVVAFEPFVELFERHLIPLKSQFLKFSCINKAVAHDSGSAKFYVARAWPVDFEFYGEGNSTTSLHSSHMASRQVEELDVQTIAFSELLNSYKQIDLMKVDCEGAEFDFLLRSDLLELKRCNQISLEFHIRDRFETKFTRADIESCVKRIVSLGFEAHVFGDRQEDYLFVKR